MKWNQKGIIACVILFFVIMGALLIQGIQPPSGEKTTSYGYEEDVVSRIDSKEETTEPTKEPEQSEKAKKDTIKKEEPKKEKSKKEKSKPKQQSKQKKKIISHEKNDEVKKQKETKGKKAAKAPTRLPVQTKSDETAKPTQIPELKVSFEIECKKILDKKDLWKKGIEEVIPSSGIYYNGKCSFSKGESVYDLLKRVTKENNIALDSVYTPLYGTYYVKGIGGLYEFDCGSESGWMYSVNGQTPDVGSSKYTVSNGDKIVFFYVYEY